MNTMTGTDIAEIFFEKTGQAQVSAQDCQGDRIDEDTHTWCEIYMDMDYLQAWCLRVDTHSSGTCDRLFVFKEHTDTPQVEWYNHPYDWRTSQDDLEWESTLLAAHHRFMDWVQAMCEAYTDRLRARRG